MILKNFLNSSMLCSEELVHVNEESTGYYDILTDVISQEESLDVFKEADRRDLLLRIKNLRDLKTIQKIILVEEGSVFSLDETLARILSFYGRFVPFK